MQSILAFFQIIEMLFRFVRFVIKKYYILSGIFLLLDVLLRLSSNEHKPINGWEVLLFLFFVYWAYKRYLSKKSCTDSSNLVVNIQQNNTVNKIHTYNNKPERKTRRTSFIHWPKSRCGKNHIAEIKLHEIYDFV